MSTRHKLGYCQRDLVIYAIRGLIIIAFLLAVSCFTKQVYADEGDSASDPLAMYIDTYCKKDCVDSGLLRTAVSEATVNTKVDPVLLLAVIQVESGFHHKALNTVNGKSVGLTQVQVYWHRDKFKSGNYFDVFENVKAGSDILNACQAKHRGDVNKALWCYNGHQPNGVAKYSKKVLAAYTRLKNKLISI